MAACFPVKPEDSPLEFFGKDHSGSEIIGRIRPFSRAKKRRIPKKRRRIAVICEY